MKPAKRHTHHALDKPDTTNFGRVYDYKRASYPSFDHSHDDDSEDDHDHDLTVRKRDDPAPKYAPIGRYVREGNTDFKDFYKGSTAYSYLPRSSRKDPIPEGIDWANWARSFK